MGNAHKKWHGKKKSGGNLAGWLVKPHREPVCPSCGRPHVEVIQPPPDHRFSLGNIELQVFETWRFGKLDFEIGIQCLRKYRDRWYRRDLIPFEEFEHLAFLVIKALRLMQAAKKK